MRSSAFVVAFLAASTVASPIQRKARDLVEEVVVVTQTQYVTVSQPIYFDYQSRTAIQPPPTVVADPEPTPPPSYVEVSEVQAPPPEPTEPAPAPAPAPPEPTEPAPAPAPAPAPPASYVPTGDYATNCVNAHNVHRANHSAPDVSWDAELASIASQIAATCTWGHDTTTGGGGYGQNIAAGTPAEEVAKVISDSWYNGEVNFYPQYGVPTPDMGNFEQWGHFSQVVWKDTTLIGCATQSCPGGVAGLSSDVGPHFTVCNYRKTGNVMDFFDQNVLPSIGSPTITG